MYCRWELLICICFASVLPLIERGKSVILFNFCVSEVSGLEHSLVQGREC